MRHSYGYGPNPPCSVSKSFRPPPTSSPLPISVTHKHVRLLHLHSKYSKTMRLLEGKPTPHTIAIGLSSLTLLALSIALLALEARVQDAFRNQSLQYPGSSIAEFIFVPLNPPTIDVGPTIVKFAVGAYSLIVALLGIAWLVVHWCSASGRASAVHVRSPFPQILECMWSLKKDQD